MGWRDTKHVCDLPLYAHGSYAKVGRWFECKHCRLNWQVQAMVPDTRPMREGFYKLTFVRREGDLIITRSWLEDW